MDSFDVTDFNNQQDELIDADDQVAVDLAISICNSIPFRNKLNKPANTDNYKVLSSDEIVQYVVDFVQEVNGIIQLTTTVTRMLLSHCKWDKILLMEKFYADPEKLFKEARVLNPFNVQISADSPTNECEICFDDLSTSATATSACGHRFCTGCWSEYLKVKIMDDGVGNSILCAANDCDVIIDDETVTELVDDLDVRRRYQHLITNSYVQHNQLLRWCPAPGCSFAIKVDYSPLKPISCHCNCGHEFCFDCTEEWHEPAPCELVKRFRGHLAEGLFHIRWGRPNDYSCMIDDRIKNCPNSSCAVSIQKVFGCNVMQCKSCSTIFCWRCLNRFKTKYAVYQHSCPGEPKTEDETAAKPTEKAAEKNASDDIELAPPKKFSKLNADLVSTMRKKTTEAAENGQKDANHRGDDTTIETLPQLRLNWREQLESIDSIKLREQLNDDINRKSVPEIKPLPVKVGLFENLLARRQKMVTKAAALPEWDPRRIRTFPAGATRWNNKYYNKYTTEDTHFRAELAQSAQIKELLRYCADKSAIFVQFELATNFLVQSRQTLKYSAIFAMYMKNVDESMLFKNLHLDLEVATNTLSNSISPVNVQHVSADSRIAEFVLPAFKNCQLRRRALLNYIDEGYDNEWWFFEDRPANE